MKTLPWILAGCLASANALAGTEELYVIAADNAKTPGWDDRVKAELVATFDLNGSDSIDNKKELAAVTCDHWNALDKGVVAAWTGSGLRTIYGFGKQFIYVGYAIGIDESLRKKADKILKGCGLQ